MITESLEKDKLLKKWYDFRNELEVIPDPINAVTRFFLSKPRVKFYTDPYDQLTWPTPWELITENEYCPINLLLGICYTLQLTERFSHLTPEIAIAVDVSSKTVYYLLLIEDKVFGWNDDEWSSVKELPKSLKIQKIFNMAPLH